MTLTSAAIVIQAQIRHYLRRHGYYLEASNRYIDSEEELDEIKTEVKQPPASTLVAQMSPLRTQKNSAPEK